MSRLRAARAVFAAVCVLAVLSVLAVTALAAGTPTIELKSTQLSGQLEDPTNPTLEVTVGQEEVSPAELEVEAVASTDESVAPLGAIKVSGEGATREVAVEPGGVGITEITLRVSGVESKTAEATLTYGASPAFGYPSTSRSLQGAADVSAAVDAGEGWVVTTNADDNTIRLFDSTKSGEATKSWKMPASYEAVEGESMDLRSGFRQGKFFYFAGSMGNDAEGNELPNASIIVRARQTGFGGGFREGGTELNLEEGSTRAVRPALIAWDEEHGDRFGLAEGFRLGAIEVANNESLAYLALETTVDGGEALIVPETTNFNSLFEGAEPTFGEPILLNLGGLGIRDLRRSEISGEYLILAGEPGGGESTPARLFRWDGGAAVRKERVRLGETTSFTLPAVGGTWEGVVRTPAESGPSATLVAAQGSTDLYETGVPDREMPAGPLRKSGAHVVTPLGPGLPSEPISIEAVDAFGPGGPGDVDVTWEPPTSDGGSAITGYEVKVNGGGEPIRLIPVGNVTSYRVEGLTRGEIYGFSVAAINENGEGPFGSGNNVWLEENSSVSPGSIDFGSQPQETIGPAHAAVFTGGSRGFFPSKVRIVGPDRDDFIVNRDECTGALVLFGETCEVSIRFAPEAAGPRTAVLEVEDRSGAPILDVPLEGDGGSKVGEEAPTNFSPPTISGKARVKGELICAPGGWSAVPAATFTYKWQRDAKDISGATSSTYVPVKADKREEVRCEVTGTNSAGSASAFSSAVKIKKAK